MNVGIIKEIQSGEDRIALVPEAAAELTAVGAAVVMEKGAGTGAGFADAEFVRAGVRILPSAAAVLETVDLVVKVKGPTAAEFDAFRHGQALFCFLVLQNRPELVDFLLSRRLTALAFEAVRTEAGRFALLEPMSTIAGQQAVFIGQDLLSGRRGGPGISLVRYPGLAPARVAVLGGGTAGKAAARTATGVMLLAHGLWQTLFPFHLACDWGAHVFRLVETAADVRFLGAAAVLLTLAGVGLWCLRRHGLLALAVAQFLGFAFVTSNILVPIETIYAERLYYIPAVGLSLLVAWIASRFTGQAASARARAVVLVVVGGWCVLGAGWCVKRCFDWRDMETLVFADVGAQPRSLFLNLQASGLCERRGDRAQRDRFLEQARELDPTSPWIQMTGAHYRLAEDDLEAAARMYADALTSPRLDAGERPYVRQNLAAILLRLGRRAEARASFTAIMNADAPLLAHTARVSLLWMAHQDGDVAEMRALITAGRRDLVRIAAVIGRERAAADYRLFEGLLAYRRGDHKAAVEDLARALSILETRRSDPRRVPAVLAYIESLAAVGQLDAARKMTASYLWSPNLLTEDRPKFQALARRFGLDRTIQRR